MNPKTQRIIARCNIIFNYNSFNGLFATGRIMAVQELDSFYYVTAKISNGTRPSLVDRKILLLTNGETYRLGKIPDRDYSKGQKIRIVKSSFSSISKK